MKHAHVRSGIPDVIPTSDWRKAGRRPPRGVRVHNRRAIAQFRRGVRVVNSRAIVIEYVGRNDYLTRARNERGDCPYCGDFGPHKQVKRILRDTGEEVTCSQCDQCHRFFEPFAGAKKPDPPPRGKVFEDLLPSRDDYYHDCPSCSSMNITTYAMLPSRVGVERKVGRCPNGHLFKPGSYEHYLTERVSA